MKSMTVTDDHLYLQVATGIEKMIADDVLKIGDKLPSVRMLSEEYGISMGTAFQAYYHLEGKGLIESRPKSGYYCLLYTSDAADERSSVDLGGRRIIKKKKTI